MKKYSVIRVVKKDFNNLKKNDIVVLFTSAAESVIKTLCSKVTKYNWAFVTTAHKNTSGDLALSCFNEHCDRGAVIKISESENVYECRNCGTLYTVNDKHAVDME